jgi:antitoxin component YwqK of YwqJK toxin-antitoxin module
MYYDYSKSKTKPDFYSLDINKDTVDFCINEFDNQDIVLKTEIFNYGKIGNKTFYENGKEIGLISIDKNASFKMTEAYSYFENGDLKETKSYHEGLKNTL